MGHLLTTCIAVYYYVNCFGMCLHTIAPSFTFNMLACISIAYYTELLDRKEFLETKRSQTMQKDLNKVIKLMPEGVMIFERYNLENLKLWNDQFMQLFGAKPPGLILGSEGNIAARVKTPEQMEAQKNVEYSWVSKLMNS